MGLVSTEVEQRLPVMVAADIGQIHDPTAICVAEVYQVDTGKWHYGEHPEPARYTDMGVFVPAKDVYPVLLSHYAIRHIRRLALGTSYPAVATHLADLLCNERFAHRDVRCFLDVTGVGRGVYDMLTAEISFRKEAQHVQLKPITFSFGEKYNRSTGVLAKAYLVSRLQSLLQGGRVHGPDTPEMRATTDELKVYEIKVSDDGKDTYGASIGKHDDLATALGLSCLEDPFSERVSYSKRVY
jgi:hypothetical protein